LPREWGKLDPEYREQAVKLFYRLFIQNLINRIKSWYYRKPRILRYANAHFWTTATFLFFMPPPTELPGISVLIVWAASFSATYTLMLLFRL
jgi:hypothetical protein